MSDEITAGVLEILYEYAENKPGEMSTELTFDELEIDSLALVEIIFDLEEKFDITIPDPKEMEGMGDSFTKAGHVVDAVKQLVEQKQG